MLEDHQLSPPEILKRFDFLNIETPAAREWARRYLLKQKKIQIPEHSPHMDSIKFELLNHIRAHHLSDSDIKNLSRTMGNAWRVMLHRKAKDIGTLSVSMPKAVLRELDEMCRWQKKAEILTLLINGGYEQFLESKKTSKAKKAEEKQPSLIPFDLKIYEHQLKSLLGKADDTEEFRKLQAQNEDLKNSIATLYDLIYSANERGQSIDDSFLIEATKVYYSAFSKTKN